jgi:hypothetical protein
MTRTYHVLGVPLRTGSLHPGSENDAQEAELPAAYFPHVQGVTRAEATELLAVLLKDPRVRLVEVSEYASLRDLDRRAIGRLVEMLTPGLKI